MEIRKISTFVEETLHSTGKSDGVPLRKVGVVAVVNNPFARRYQEDLTLLINESADIGRRISKLAVEAMGPYGIESYGKAAVVGTDGEQEHGVAMLTTVFGNILREAVGGGKAWISSTTKRGVPGTIIDVPLAFKDALYVRSHYDTMTLTLHDAPLPDEIAVIVCVANRGRLNARVGGLTVNQVKGENGLD
ncbi:amino acid synthesis family protein [Kyrpidia sp.]|uniref:amino acid synthesis family protein n=1 Tax=Kyrpidia sp. TaxID=2073077 RepID=UPI00258A0FFC|nr:amino acid synthesis family protein [Kyrpidia sp.]MCL6577438.1 amino acid synthesis family protein [Kyrpidia sp.]